MKDFANKVEQFGDAMVHVFHLLALFIIGGTVIWSAAVEYITIINTGTVGLKDILLLFIYLELGAMVGIYFRTKKLPVIFLIYIAITALTRVLAVDIKTMESEKVLALSGAIAILSLSGVIMSLRKSRWLVSAKDET